MFFEICLYRFQQFFTALFYRAAGEIYSEVCVLLVQRAAFLIEVFQCGAAAVADNAPCDQIADTLCQYVQLVVQIDYNAGDFRYCMASSL